MSSSWEWQVTFSKLCSLRVFSNFKNVIPNEFNNIIYRISGHSEGHWKSFHVPRLVHVSWVVKLWPRMCSNFYFSTVSCSSHISTVAGTLAYLPTGLPARWTINLLVYQLTGLSARWPMSPLTYQPAGLSACCLSARCLSARWSSFRILIETGNFSNRVDSRVDPA